jgi:hypothetical protein
MKFNINQNVINQATNCRENNSCLSGNKNCLCNVSDSVDNKIIFVDPAIKNSCYYKSSFGYSYMCTCPVRNMIFLKYKQ